MKTIIGNSCFFYLQAELNEEIEEVERAKEDASRIKSKMSVRDDDSDDESESGGGTRIPFEEFTVYVPFILYCFLSSVVFCCVS